MWPLTQLYCRPNPVVVSLVRLRSPNFIPLFYSRRRLLLLFCFSSRLDYCSSLYLGLSNYALSWLQLVQNSAASVLFTSSKRTHSTPILAKLYWLPVIFRIDLKILSATFKAWHGLASNPYFRAFSSGRLLRSSQSDLPTVLSSRLKTEGDRSLSL